MRGWMAVALVLLMAGCTSDAADNDVVPLEAAMPDPESTVVDLFSQVEDNSMAVFAVKGAAAGAVRVETDFHLGSQAPDACLTVVVAAQFNGTEVAQLVAGRVERLDDYAAGSSFAAGESTMAVVAQQRMSVPVEITADMEGGYVGTTLGDGEAILVLVGVDGKDATATGSFQLAIDSSGPADVQMVASVPFRCGIGFEGLDGVTASAGGKQAGGTLGMEAAAGASFTMLRAQSANQVSVGGDQATVDLGAGVLPLGTRMSEVGPGPTLSIDVQTWESAPAWAAVGMALPLELRPLGMSYQNGG